MIEPSSGNSRPAIMFSSVDLPQPLGPTRQTNSPSSTSQAHVVERVRLDHALAKPLRHAVDGQLDGRDSRSSRRARSWRCSAGSWAARRAFAEAGRRQAGTSRLISEHDQSLEIAARPLRKPDALRLGDQRFELLARDLRREVEARPGLVDDRRRASRAWSAP